MAPGHTAAEATAEQLALAAAHQEEAVAELVQQPHRAVAEEAQHAAASAEADTVAVVDTPVAAMAADATKPKASSPWVPHPHDGLIVVRVGIERSSTFAGSRTPQALR
jgi:hypothetical protein